MKIHETEKLHPCSMCNFISHSYYGLKKHHSVVHHSTSLEPVVMVSKLDHLDESIKNSQDSPSKRSESKRPTCPTCLVVFKSKISLTKHKSKGCKGICSSTNGALPEPVVLVPKIELLEKLNNPPCTSSQSKELTCFVCMRVFKNKNVLRKHEEKGCKGILRSEKGFHCPYCMFVGTRLRSTEDHLGCHTGARRFRCPYCPYQCARNTILKQHVHKRHPECI